MNLYLMLDMGSFIPCSIDKFYISWPEVIKLFSCSTQLSTKFILLINVKMPTIVGILTIISRINIMLINVKMPTIVGILTIISIINTTSQRLKARNFFICQYLSFYEFVFNLILYIPVNNFSVMYGRVFLAVEPVFTKQGLAVFAYTS